MSRIGNKLIEIPADVTVTISGAAVSVVGPKGQLEWQLPPAITVKLEGSTIGCSRSSEEKHIRALHGLVAAQLANMISGVSRGFSRELELNGVGFKVTQKGQDLEMSLGFSHPVHFAAPAGVELKVEKNLITVSGIDKQLVGNTAAQIRALKKPEPYKGKGIKYVEETILRKAGKTAAGGK